MYRWIWRAKNFLIALYYHLKCWCKSASKSEQVRRWNVCNQCVFNVDSNCDNCGCFLSEKISWDSSDCPLGYWDENGLQYMVDQGNRVSGGGAGGSGN